VTRGDETGPQADFKESELTDRRPCGARLMTELEMRREIIYAMDECKYLGQRLRKHIEKVIEVDTLATIITRSFAKQGLLDNN
jgi:hypothetical protein